MTDEMQRRSWREAKDRQRSDPDKKKTIAENRRRNRKQEYEWLAKRKKDRALWAQLHIPKLRHRAKKNGLEFDITADDIPLPDVCPVFGFPLLVGCGGNAYNSYEKPSVDRFDNSKGYIKGNVRVISTRANILKKDATIDEIRALLHYMESGS